MLIEYSYLVEIYRHRITDRNMTWPVLSFYKSIV